MATMKAKRPRTVELRPGDALEAVVRSEGKVVQRMRATVGEDGLLRMEQVPTDDAPPAVTPDPVSGT